MSNNEKNPKMLSNQEYFEKACDMLDYISRTSRDVEQVTKLRLSVAAAINAFILVETQKRIRGEKVYNTPEDN